MNSRLFWFLLGCVVGLILGYLVRSLRDIKDKVDLVDKHVTEDKRNDAGWISAQRVKDIALFIVVVLTVYASFVSQRTSNKVSDQSDDLAAQQTVISQQQTTIAKQQAVQNKLISCNQAVLQGTLAALNARTQYTIAQSQANIDLQKAFNTVVTASLQEPPIDEATGRKIVEDYAKALSHFLEISGKNVDQIDKNPYPTPTALLDCVNQK